MIHPQSLRACAAAILLLAAVGACSQNAGSSGLNMGVPAAATGRSRQGMHPIERDASGDPLGQEFPPSPERRKLQREMALRRNQERQRKIQSDGERLMALASGLQLAIRASQQTALTPAQIKQVEEIEKLAKDVKRKMLGDN